MMAEMEMREGSLTAAVAVEEEESLLMEGVTLLDFDMLCSTVAMQAQKGKWGKLNQDNEEENIVSRYEFGGGVFRLWEGELIYDCFDDRRVALQSTCCPCYRFGKNMKRAGFGSCFLQGSIHLILAVTALSNLLAFMFTGRRCFLYLALVFTVSVGTYKGFYRALIKKKFNIKVSDSSFDDCVYHIICPCCTLSQESRTLEMNNVQDGIWHGRGDTICIGSYSEDNKAFSTLSSTLSSTFPVPTKSPECLGMQKNSNDSIHLSTSIAGHSSLSIPPPE